jgi:hypothetical protein
VSHEGQDDHEDDLVGGPDEGGKKHCPRQLGGIEPNLARPEAADPDQESANQHKLHCHSAGESEVEQSVRGTGQPRGGRKPLLRRVPDEELAVAVGPEVDKHDQAEARE